MCVTTWEEGHQSFKTLQSSDASTPRPVSRLADKFTDGLAQITA